MIDFGLIALFSIQVGLVALSYHFWRESKSASDRIPELDTRIKESAFLVSGFSTRIDSLNEAPKKLVTRIEAFEEATKESEKLVEKLKDRVASLQASFSARERWSKKKNLEEMGPASEEEVQEEFEFPTVPVSPPPLNQVSGSFGKQRRG